MMEEREVEMTCQKCGIEYSRRRWANHTVKCEGGPEGFTPVHVNRRWEYACQTCKMTVRKERAEAHRNVCAARQRSFLAGGKKILTDGISTEISGKNGKNDEVSEMDIFRVAISEEKKTSKISRPGSEVCPIDIIDEQDVHVIDSLGQEPLLEEKVEKNGMINENVDFHMDKPQKSYEQGANDQPMLPQRNDKLPHKNDKLPHKENQVSDLLSHGRQQVMVIEDSEQPEVHFQVEQHEVNSGDDLYFQDQDQSLNPPAQPTQQQVAQEKIHSSIENHIKTKKIYKGKRLSAFRTSVQAVDAGPQKILEIYTLSSLLRLVGRYSHQGVWEQRKGMIEKQQFWNFMHQYNRMVTMKPGARQYCQKVILKPYHYSDGYYCIANFESLFLRVKQLIMQYEIYAEKLEMIFRVPLWKRKDKNKRLVRKAPQTAVLRKKMSQYKYRIKLRNKMTAIKRGCYQKVKVKYDYLTQSVHFKDDYFETTNRLKRKVRNGPNLKRQRLQRQKAFINYVCMSLADNITASVILGEFTIWRRSIQEIPIQERYKYQTPKLLSYKHWMPVPKKILDEKRWLFMNFAQKCARQCNMQCSLTQEQVYAHVLVFYRSHGLLVDHSLIHVEDSYNEIRAMVDSKYRVEWQERRIRQKAALIDINPKIIDQESELDGDQNVDEALKIFDQSKWRMTRKCDNKTQFQTCALCELKVKYPVTCCRNCLGLYHSKCRESLQQCLCEEFIEEQKRERMFFQAIEQAHKKSKIVELEIPTPPKASIREIQAQKRDLDLNLAPMQKPSFWCHPSPIVFVKTDTPFLGPKTTQILNLYTQDKAAYPVYVAQSEKRGRGLYADRDIKEGELTAIYSGRLINKLQVMAQANESRYLFDFQRGKGPYSSFTFIPDTHTHLGQFLNHSRNGNVKPDKYWTSKGPIIIFRATRDIQQTQQLFFDYGSNYPIVDSVEVVKKQVNKIFKQVVKSYAHHQELPPLSTMQVIEQLPKDSPFHVVTFSKQELGKHAKIGHHMLIAKLGRTVCVFDTGVSKQRLSLKLKNYPFIFIFSQKQKQQWQCGYITIELATRLKDVDGLSLLEHTGVANVAYERQENILIDLDEE